MSTSDVPTTIEMSASPENNSKLLQGLTKDYENRPEGRIERNISDQYLYQIFGIKF